MIQQACHQTIAVMIQGVQPPIEEVHVYGSMSGSSWSCEGWVCQDFLRNIFRTQESAASGPGKWQTTDVDKQGVRNMGQMMATRLRTLGDEGRLWGSDGKDFEGTVQDVTQAWTALTTTEAQGLKENGLISVERTYGETRMIRQMYLEGGDAWKTTGKSWYWQPVVPNIIFEFKEP